MIKKILLLILILSIPAAVFSITATMKTQIISSEKTLLVNNNKIEGKWEFEYSVYEGQVTNGDLKDGPMIAYVTTIIQGKITTKDNDPVLNGLLKSKSKFNVVYILKSNLGVQKSSFGDCEMQDVRTVKGSDGSSKVIYTFRAQSLS